MVKLDTATRQGQIKKAVLDIISTEGIGKLSTRNLAARIGVSEGALFRHFSSKKEIMLSILGDVKHDLLDEQEKIVYSGLKADEKLRGFLCLHVKYLIQNKGITMLLFSEAAHLNEPKLKMGLREILLTQKEHVSRIVRQGISEGIWDSSLTVEDVVLLYMGIPITLNIELILQTDEIVQEKFCARMLPLFTKLLGKK
jgi:AcrR family transcriptional regulator